MQDCCIISGGAYFTDERIGFWDGFEKPSQITADMIVFPQRTFTDIVGAKHVFCFGIKTWVRRLKKKGFKWSRIADEVVDYLEVWAGRRPFGILDDMNLVDELNVGDRLRKQIFEKLNCKVYLLREYLSTKQYDKRVIPFSIPCLDMSFFATGNKPVDLYFRGDASNDDRSHVLKKFKKLKPEKAVLELYKGGEKARQKLPWDKYLMETANSHVCLSFPGAGFCTFRYQEIPAVGSIIATQRHPWVVRNDYPDEACIRYENPQEVLDVLKDRQRLEDMQGRSIEHFKKYHTTEVRRNEFFGYLDELRRD